MVIHFLTIKCRSPTQIYSIHYIHTRMCVRLVIYTSVDLNFVALCFVLLTQRSANKFRVVYLDYVQDNVDAGDNIPRSYCQWSLVSGG